MYLAFGLTNLFLENISLPTPIGHHRQLTNSLIEWTIYKSLKLESAPETMLVNHGKIQCHCNVYEILNTTVRGCGSMLPNDNGSIGNAHVHTSDTQGTPDKLCINLVTRAVLWNFVCLFVSWFSVMDAQRQSALQSYENVSPCRIKLCQVRRSAMMVAMFYTW